MCVYQGKKTRDDVRAAMFKTVFGNSAYRALISRHRRRHVGAGSPDSDSSASTDSDEGAAGAAHGVTGDERLFDDGSYEKTSACYSAGLSRGVCAAFKCVRVWLCMCVYGQKASCRQRIRQPALVSDSASLLVPGRALAQEPCSKPRILSQAQGLCLTRWTRSQLVQVRSLLLGTLVGNRMRMRVHMRSL